MRHALVLVALASVPGTVLAQSQTEQKLNDGVKFYQNLQTAQARDAFLAVLSPGWQFDVTRDQRVKADKYLGAVLATEGQKDSAQIYFRAALERDPFTDLETSVFTAQERQAFAESKRNVFKIGIKQIQADTLDPRLGHVTITLVTTHSASLGVQVVGLSDSTLFPLYQGDNDGIRTIQWNGTVNSRGILIPPGQFELRVLGTSNVNRSVDSAVVYFEVVHDHAKLDDTLKVIPTDSFLPERHPANAAMNALLMGGAVAAAAFVIPKVGFGGSLAVPQGPAIGVSGLALLTGVMAYVNRQGHPEIPENVKFNQQMRQLRADKNASLLAANDAKLAATKLVITPVLLAGGSQ